MRRFRLPRPLLATLLVLGAAGATPAADPAAHTYDVRAFGATGDGRTLDTDAINRAILAAHAAGGGTVGFPAGTYLSASIHLQSNLTLSLAPGSTIEAVSDALAKYDPAEPNEWDTKFHYQDHGHSHWQDSLIWGIDLENVSIVGPGLIHGKGLNPGVHPHADTAKGEKIYQDGGPGSGNKAIALKNCRNVTLRDFSILHGGWFGILATGVSNLTVDNLKIDTNRDGMDIDCCRNVRIVNCSVNSPWDDGICLKATYALGELRACEAVTISGCLLAGSFDEGTLLDGTFKVSTDDYKSYHTGRIKLGTESDGDFKNIAIANCVFDGSRGIAIESVDGAHIEDVAISNITMRHVSNSPIFIRLGNRARGPGPPPVGSIRRISISNLVASDADGALGCIVSGIPGHPVEDIRLSNLRLGQQGGGATDLAERVPPEEENKYPEPGMFGPMPSFGLFLRHATGIEVTDTKIDCAKPDARPAFVLDDVRDAAFARVIVPHPKDASAFDLRGVSNFSVKDSRGLPDTQLATRVERQKL